MLSNDGKQPKYVYVNGRLANHEKSIKEPSAGLPVSCSMLSISFDGFAVAFSPPEMSMRSSVWLFSVASEVGVVPRFAMVWPSTIG